MTDIRLPDMSGHEVYQGLREDQPKARVILMTGYGYDPGALARKGAGGRVGHVFYKPFRVDQLRDALLDPDRAARPASPRKDEA